MILFDLRFQEPKKLTISIDVLQDSLSDVDVMLCAVHAKQKELVLRRRYLPCLQGDRCSCHWVGVLR